MSASPTKCANPLIHDEHDWLTYEQPEPDADPDHWAPVNRHCEGNDDDDVELDRYECCAHCGHPARREGEIDPCKTRDCPGTLMLGQPAPRN